MAYTKEALLTKINEAGRADIIAQFYQQNFVNYLGQTSDTKDFYTEITAEWCLRHLDLLNRIPQITRRTSYRTETHDGCSVNSSSNRTEEHIAMAMFRQGCLPLLGRVLDYQTPLKNTSTDKAGKIDLLAYDGATLRILELKKPDSTETMLRCVLEGWTYLKTVDTAKLLRDFSLPADTPVRASPFVFLNGQQHREMSQHRPQLNLLMEQLDSRPYYIVECQDGDYDVTEGTI